MIVITNYFYSTLKFRTSVNEFATSFPPSLAPSVSVTLRTCHVETPAMDISTAHIVEGLICPAPPSHPEITGDALSRLIVPMPSSESPSLWLTFRLFTFPSACTQWKICLDCRRTRVLPNLETSPETELTFY